MLKFFVVIGNIKHIFKSLKISEFFNFVFYEIQGLFEVHESFVTCKFDAYVVFKTSCSLQYKKLHFKIINMHVLVWFDIVIMF